MFFHSSQNVEFSKNSSCFISYNESKNSDVLCNVNCENFSTNCLYVSSTFWGFVLLLSIGNIGFNVVNSISDAICFDILGEGKLIFTNKCLLLIIM